MKGIDTNILVRYILQDHPQQYAQANSFIEKEKAAGRLIFINGTVLCEFVWVLETAYDYLRLEIAPVIEKILRTRQFCIYQSEVLWQSLYGYQKEGADFADHYIANLNMDNGCEYTVTFDKKAGRLKHFKKLDI